MITLRENRFWRGYKLVLKSLKLFGVVEKNRCRRFLEKKRNGQIFVLKILDFFERKGEKVIIL